MTSTKPIYLRAILAACILAPVAAAAQQDYEYTICRAGTLSVLAQGEKVIVWQLDHRGVSVADTPDNPFHGFTQRCVGTVASVEGQADARGWCRGVDPQTGDWTLVDWTGSGKPGHGTWSFRHGTGKWKGVSGGGTYEPIGPTKPVEPGTYQNCVRVKAKVRMPG